MIQILIRHQCCQLALLAPHQVWHSLHLFQCFEIRVTDLVLTSQTFLSYHLMPRPRIESAELSKGLIHETLTTELPRPRDIIHLKLPSWRLAKWVSEAEIFWAETWSIEKRPERKLVGRPLRARIDNFEAVLLLSSRLKPATLIHKSSSSPSSPSSVLSSASLDVHRNTTSRL